MDHCEISTERVHLRAHGKPPTQRPAQYFNPTLVVITQQKQQGSRMVTIPDPFPPQLSVVLPASRQDSLDLPVETLLLPHPQCSACSEDCLLSKQGNGKWFYYYGHVYIWEIPSPYKSSEVIPFKTLTQPFKDSFGEHFHTTLHAD